MGSRKFQLQRGYQPNPSLLNLVPGQELLFHSSLGREHASWYYQLYALLVHLQGELHSLVADQVRSVLEVGSALVILLLGFSFFLGSL
jgi:hypothetical protein